MLAALLILDLVAVVGGKVHTLVPGSAPAEAVVLIDGDRIRAVGAGLAVPSDARVVDARGLHVVPGLIDGFAFHDPEHDALYVAAGVTLVRDHGNELGRIFASRERDERDRRGGPLLSIAGGVIDGTPPATNAAIVVRSKDEAREAVLHLYEEKIDFVAFHSNLGLEAWGALCEAAAEKGLAVWGPRLAGHSLEAALAGGQRGFVFLDAVLPPGRGWDQVEISAAEAEVARLVAAKGAIVPALRGYSRLLAADSDKAPELSLLGAQYEALWLADLSQRQEQLTSEARSAAGAVIGKQRALLPLLHRAGAQLVPGSGAPHPWLMPGEGLVRELAEWQATGIPAADCLAYATRGAAQALGLAKDRGTLEAGKLADLVLLRADPSADVQALAQVEGVVLRGKPLSRAELDARLAEVRASSSRQKAEAAAPIAVDPPALPEGEVLLSGRFESAATAGRIAAERFAVVREVDGTLTLCGRRRLLPSAGSPGSEVEVRQRLVKDALDSFDVKVRNSGHELLVRGQRVAGQWRVERRFDGNFVDIQVARESLAAIDCDSVTTFILLAHTRGAGHFPVVRFDEGLQLEVVRWDLAFDERGDHAFRTPGGAKIARFLENGAVSALFEQVGSGLVQSLPLELDAHGGAGLPLPADKLERVRKAQAEKAASGGDGGK